MYSLYMYIAKNSNAGGMRLQSPGSWKSRRQRRERKRSASDALGDLAAGREGQGSKQGTLKQHATHYHRGVTAFIGDLEEPRKKTEGLIR